MDYNKMTKAASRMRAITPEDVIRYNDSIKEFLIKSPPMRDITGDAARRTFTQHEALKDVVFHRGLGSAEGMVSEMIKQPILQKQIKKINMANPNLPSPGEEAIKNSIRLQFLGGHGIGGTINTEGGRKMVHINREATRNPIVHKAFGVSNSSDAMRNMLRHEKFHHTPIIGKSELLAHIAGGTAVGGNIFDKVKAVEGGTGAKAKYIAGGLGAKGKSMGRSYLNLWMSRPDRALIEHAILGTGIYGGVKAGKAISGAIKKNKDKKQQAPQPTDKIAMKLASLAANGNK